MITENKVTEIFCIADDSCKVFDAQMATLVLLIHQAVDSFLSLLSQLVEEIEEEEHPYYGKAFIHLHTEEDAVEDSVCKDWSCENHHFCYRAAIDAEVEEAVVIAHQDSKEEMSWD